MPALTLHINAAGLLDHSIVVVNVIQSADILQMLMEFFGTDGLADKFFPAAAMNQNAV